MNRTLKFEIRGVFACAERSDDGHAHAESGILAADAGADGGHGLVQSQLFAGPGPQLGQEPGLRFRDEELQTLDGHKTRKGPVNPSVLQQSEKGSTGDRVHGRPQLRGPVQSSRTRATVAELLSGQ